MNTNHYPAVLALGIAAVSVGCQPVEYAEDLSPSVLELRHFGYTIEKAGLTIYAEGDDTPVWDGVWSGTTTKIESFKVPDGSYHAKLRYDLDGDGHADTAKSYFAYTQKDGGTTGFSSLEYLAGQVAGCYGSEGESFGNQQGVMAALMANFLVAPYVGPQSDTEQKYLIRLEAALSQLASDLGVTKLEILDAIGEDVQIDCDLNSATQNTETGAVNGISLGGEPFNAKETLTLLAAAVNELGVANADPMPELSIAILDSSKGVLKATGSTYHDQSAPTVTAVSDLAPSIFGKTTLSFAVNDNVGVGSVSATLNGQSSDSDSYDAATGDYQVTFDVSGMHDGKATLAFSIIDLVSNHAQPELAVTIDNTGPAISLQDPVYTNETKPIATVKATPPTGTVVSLSVNGAEFTNSSKDLWSGPVSLNQAKNDLVVTAETSFGLAKEVTLIAFLDQQPPNLTFVGSASPISNGDGSGSNTSTDIVLDLENGYHLDYRQARPYLLGANENPSDLSSENVPFITATSIDQSGTGQSNQNGITLWYRFTTPAEEGTWQQLDNGKDTLSLTKERLGQHLVEMESKDQGFLDFKAIDLAGNETTDRINFQAYQERQTIQFTSVGMDGKLGLNLMDGGNSFPVAKCSVTANTCDLPALLFDQSYSLDLTKLDYVDYFGNMVELIDEPSVQALPIINRSESYEFSPFLYLITEAANFHRTQGYSHQTALNEAITMVEESFVGITNEPHLYMSMINGYSDQAEATVIRAGLARAAQRIELEYGESCTVFNLANKIAFDYSDNGKLDGSTSERQDGCGSITSNQARMLLAAGTRDEMIDRKLTVEGNDFDKIGRRFWDPTVPTVQGNVEVSTYSGVLMITPTSTAETEYAEIEIRLNNILIATLQQDQTFAWDTTTVPNGNYVIDFDLIDGYFQRASSGVYISVQN